MERASARQLAPELDDMVRRCARLQRGLAFLHRAPIEPVAVALGVHPAAVERARALLDNAEQRALAIDAFVAAVAEGVLEPRGEGPAAEARPPCGADLIDLARSLPGGLDLLAGAPVDAAAVVFGVHPRLVIEARQTLS